MARGGGRSGGGGGSRSSHSSSRGMTSGRSGGGSRSFGSGTRSAGSRSFSGGFGSGGTHRGGAGFGGPGAPHQTGGGSRSGGFDGGRPTPPPPPRRAYYGGFGGWGRRARYGGGYYGGPVYTGGPSYGGGMGCGGCLVALVVIALVFMLLSVSMPAACVSLGLMGGSGSGSSSSGQIAQVSHTHEKLAASECDLSDEWLDDRAGWIDSESTVISALRYFYDKTGSQPYLVVATDVDGETDFTDAEGEEWANEIYDEHFKDDGHTVVAFVEYEESEYAYYIIAGRSAQSVIDAEAREIIADEINYWYTDGSLDDSEYFAKVFTESADTIMFEYEETTKTSNTRRRMLVIGLGAVGVAAAIGFVVMRASKHKKAEYEAAQQLAGTPVPPSTTYTSADIPTETTSSTLSELEELERKYGSD